MPSNDFTLLRASSPRGALTGDTLHTVSWFLNTNIGHAEAIAHLGNTRSRQEMRMVVVRAPGFTVEQTKNTLSLFLKSWPHLCYVAGASTPPPTPPNTLWHHASDGAGFDVMLESYMDHWPIMGCVRSSDHAYFCCPINLSSTDTGQRFLAAPQLAAFVRRFVNVCEWPIRNQDLKLTTPKGLKWETFEAISKQRARGFPAREGTPEEAPPPSPEDGVPSVPSSVLTLPVPVQLNEQSLQQRINSPNVTTDSLCHAYNDATSLLTPEERVMIGAELVRRARRHAQSLLLPVVERMHSLLSGRSDAASQIRARAYATAISDRRRQGVAATGVSATMPEIAHAQERYQRLAVANSVPETVPAAEDIPTSETSDAPIPTYTFAIERSPIVPRPLQIDPAYLQDPELPDGHNPTQSPAVRIHECEET